MSFIPRMQMMDFVDPMPMELGKPIRPIKVMVDPEADKITSFRLFESLDHDHLTGPLVPLQAVKQRTPQASDLDLTVTYTEHSSGIIHIVNWNNGHTRLSTNVICSQIRIPTYVIRAVLTENSSPALLRTLVKSLNEALAVRSGWLEPAKRALNDLVRGKCAQVAGTRCDTFDAFVKRLIEITKKQRTVLERRQRSYQYTTGARTT